METKERLLEQAAALRAKLDAIDEREWRERNKSLLGKCFKYHNSNGSGARWWLYAKVVAVRGKYDSRVFTFQTDNRGEHNIHQTDRMSPTFIGNESWKPIPHSEFTRELRKLQKKIAGYKP